MKKTQLKTLLKPIVKECINEVLLEQGLLSNIISEVVKGVQPIHISPPLVSDDSLKYQQQRSEEQRKELVIEQQRQLKEHKRKLLDAAGFETDVFADTQPIIGGIITENQDLSSEQSAPLSGIDPNDAGVDIAGIMAYSSKDWSKMI
jgi:hypothetical protein